MRIGTVGRYRMKPMIVDAIQFTGRNDAAVMAFCPTARDPHDTKACLIVRTVNGDVLVSITDWVVRDAAGGFCSCGDGLFRKIYESVG